MNRHLKKISEEILHANPWWLYKHDQYEKPNGEMGDYYYGETPGFVMIVPVLEDGRLVLIRQFRYLHQKESLGFPGGGVEAGQTVLEAAKSELIQETGCEAHEFIKIGVFEPSSGLVRDTSHVFLAEVEKKFPQQLDDTEKIEVLFRRADEIDEMIRKNEIWDGQTLATWALIHHHFLHK